MALSSLVSAALLPYRIIRQLLQPDDTLDDHDHPLLKPCSLDQPYTTSYARYPSIRTFYHPHAHARKLQAIADLPLLVFIHGLGGSLPQFAPLLGSFVNIAPIFAIELPGHGQSKFAPHNYEAYAFEALVDLWRVAIEDACFQHGHKKVVLICHSLGSSIGASLASRLNVDLDFQVLGVAAICPKATPPTQSQIRTYRRMLSLPDFVLNILRWFDRMGNETSASVKRFVGTAADVDLKRMQLRFNKRFRTPVWKRTSIGLLPHYDSQGIAHGGLPGREMWENVNVPLILIAGEGDSVTKPEEASNIVKFVQGKTGTNGKISSKAIPTALPNSPVEDGANKSPDQHAQASDELYGVHPTSSESKSKHLTVVKFVVLPTPASHALMYDHTTYRTVAGLIEDFLARHVSPSLEHGWQLQQLTTSGKWDVKNLEKWKKVAPVSGPIDSGFFRALKTLREQDEEHTPKEFIRNWGTNGKKGRIYAVIDISHDSPIYDTKAIEKGGVQYHKFPTVSKIPPTVVEVKDFIALVDRLTVEIDQELANTQSLSAPTNGVDPGPKDKDFGSSHTHDTDQRNGQLTPSNSNVKPQATTDRPAIAVHCHYGYNRTGFFIASYLIERRGWRVQDAIEEFQKAKPPGIRHDHFIDTLYVRYCIGLRRGSTFNTS